MALAVAQLVSALEDAKPDVRRAAVRALARGAANGDLAAISLLEKRTQDSDEDVREEALHGLVTVALPAEPQLHVSAEVVAVAAPAALACLTDEDGYVRRAAAHAATALCGKGDPEAISALVRCVRDDEKEVRSAIVDAVVEVAGCGSEQAVREVLPLLQTREAATTRAAATRLLSRLVMQGDAAACAAVLELCGDTEDLVRWAAARALGAMASPGSVEALDKLHVLLTDEDDDVRVEALDALSAVAIRGSAAACLPSCLKCLEEGPEDVRRSAVRAIAAVSPMGDPEVITALHSLASSSEVEVRCAMLQVAASVAQRGDAATMPLAIAALQDEDEDVRQAAAEALGQLACPHDAGILATRLASDEDESVRRAAAEALGSVAARGDASVVAALSQALRDEDYHVRCAAAASLSQVATASAADDLLAVVSALTNCLGDASTEDEARDGAADALVALVAAGPLGRDVVLVAAEQVERLLMHADVYVRCCAVRGLARLMQHQQQFHNGKPVDEAHVIWKISELLADSTACVRDAATAALVLLTGDNAAEESASLVLEAAEKQCGHVLPVARQAALEVVAKLVVASKGSSARTAATLLHGLEDTDDEVRSAAARLLAEVLASAEEPTSSSLLAGCLAHLRSGDRKTQRATASVVGSAWPQGCREAVEAVRVQVAQASTSWVRRAALECMTSAAVPCAVTAASAATASTNPSALGPVSAALAACSAVSSAIEVTVPCLSDADERVRNAAVKLLGALADASDLDKRLLLGRRAEVSHQAVEAIASLLGFSVKSGTAPVMPFPTAEIASRADMLCAGAEALGAVAARGDEAIVAMLLTMLNTDDDDVKWSVLRSLRKSAARGDKTAMSAVRRALAGATADEQVRIAAVEAFAEIAEPGDAEVQALLKERLQDSYEVARAAMRAMLALYSEETAQRALAEAAGAEPVEAPTAASVPPLAARGGS